MAERRVAGAGKRALAKQRAAVLKSAWEEAYKRGRTWKQLLLHGMTALASRPRDVLLNVVGRPREVLPGIDLTFRDPAPHYDATREVVKFAGEALGSSVECAVTREALEDHFGAAGLDAKGRVEAFHRHLSEIESLVRAKYLSDTVETAATVLLKSGDVDKLQRRDKKRRRT